MSRTRTAVPGARTLVPAAVVGSVLVAGSVSPATAAEPGRTDLRERGTRAVPATAVPAPETVVVAPGDTVTGIARQHGRRTSDVLAANGLDARGLIYPGQVLVLGDAAPAADTPAAPAPAETVHAVAPGDTVFAIGQRYGVGVSAILAANGLARDSIIYPGQTLSIPTATPVAAVAVASVTTPDGLDAEQTANAALIVRIGRELGVPDRGIAIALGTAMQESWLRNLDGGDRDSGGLFQQRPSTGWGSDAEVRDPDRATRAFYGGPGDPNGRTTRGLRDIPGWEAMSFADAAQAVQISAYPDRYARWEAPAEGWLAALT